MEQLVNKLRERLPECRIEIRDVEKNGTTKKGVGITPNEVNLGEIIYLKEFQEKYGDDLDAMADEIVEVHNRNKADKSIDVSSFFNKKYIMENVYPVLYKKENAQRYVHTDILDMAFIYKVKITSDKIEGLASISLLPEHIKAFDIDVHNLYVAAMRNLKRTGIFADMVTVLCEYSPEMAEIMRECSPVANMYVVTNKNKINGAAQMCNKNLMDDLLGTLGVNTMYVIPSSIHECIAMPLLEDTEEEREYIRNLIVSVNNTEVEPEEVLTDTLYKYSREYGLEIA